ncbi:MAG: hypothetical protein GXP46_01955 [Deferribacteres bacterium]|nr:hypothetical protein [Deferribacteres bacterium]
MGKSYTIGKGKLLFRPEGEQGYKDLGNCPDFKVTVATEKKEHYSDRSGISVKDAEIVTKQTASGGFTLDEPNIDNLNMFVMGAGTVTTQQAAGSATDQAVTALLDRWVALGKVNVSSVVVTDNSGTTTYVKGTDYELDASAGLIMALSSGSITDGESLLVDFTYPDATIKQVNAATATTVKGHIYFVGDPPVGKILDVKGYISLAPNGELSLIGEDWMQYEFEMEFLSHADYDGLFEIVERGEV